MLLIMLVFLLSAIAADFSANAVIVVVYNIMITAILSYMLLVLQITYIAAIADITFAFITSTANNVVCYVLFAVYCLLFAACCLFSVV